MQVGSVNSNVATGQQQPVKKSNAKRTATYIGAGLGTAAAVTTAVIYRKNIANMFRALKDMFTPLKTNVTDAMADVGETVTKKTRKTAKVVKDTVKEGTEALKEQAEKAKETIKDVTDDLKDKLDEGVDALRDKADEVLNSESVQNIKKEAGGFFKRTGKFIQTGFTTVWNYTKLAFNWVKDKVVNAYNEIKTFLSGMKKEAAEQVAENAK